jgi:osmoprotectant transport system substrate-binding protein
MPPDRLRSDLPDAGPGPMPTRSRSCQSRHHHPDARDLALAMSVLGIGAPSAIFGLVVLTLLPIVLNTIAGLRMVPAHLIEAAAAWDDARNPFRVELPNAAFVILAGMRTALAITVGTVPLAFLIGGGGLGELIFTGIDLMEPSMLLAGAIPTALLCDSLSIFCRTMQFGLISERGEPDVAGGAATGTTKHKKKGKQTCSRVYTDRAHRRAGWHRPRRRIAQTIVVGGKNFTEQQIMAEMTNQLLQAKGFKTDKRAGLGTAPLRQAQEAGQIDVYWEYTGTSLITFNKVTDKLDAQATYNKVKELDAAKGLVWLNPSKANNTYALAMRKDDANAKGIKSLSDLATKVKGGQNLKLASNAEFYARPDGLAPLQQTYGFEFGRENVVRMDTGLVYQALKDKQVDVGLVFATDGRVPAFDFVILNDDKGFFPSYALTPVVRKETLDKNPKLAEALNALSAKLDDATMAKLNASVDVEKKSVEEVAAGFLKSQTLI